MMRLDVKPHNSLIIYDDVTNLYSAYLNPLTNLISKSSNHPDILVEDVLKGPHAHSIQLNGYKYYGINPFENMGWNILEHIRHITDNDIINHYMKLLSSELVYDTLEDMDDSLFWRIVIAKYLTYYYIEYKKQLSDNQIMQWADFLDYIDNNDFNSQPIGQLLSSESPYVWSLIRKSNITDSLRMFTCFVSDRDNYDLDVYQPKYLAIIGDYSTMTSEMKTYVNLWKYTFMYHNKMNNIPTHTFCSNIGNLRHYIFGLLSSVMDISTIFIPNSDINQLTTKFIDTMYYVINLSPDNEDVNILMNQLQEYWNVAVPKSKTSHRYILTPYQYYALYGMPSCW